MKYKVGDKVRVREDLDIKEYGVSTGMLGYKGTIVTINYVYSRSYGVKENNYYWTDEMLEPVAENNAESDENTDEVSTNSTEIKQFTKEDLKFGDIVTLRNGDELVYTGIATMRNSEDMEFPLCEYDDKNFEYNHTDDLDIMKVKRLRQFDGTFYKYETLYERKEILTEEEKEYLEGVIRPFRERVITIYKGENKEYGYFISIIVKDNPSTELPFFKGNAMYKGMKIDKWYTLEELGL